MSYRCLVYTGKNQSQTVREYLWAITFFHKMHADWKLPTTHCTVLAVGKEFDRVEGNCDVKIPGLESHYHIVGYAIRDGKTEVLAAEGGGTVMWMRLASRNFFYAKRQNYWRTRAGGYIQIRRDLACFRGVRR